MNTLSLELQVRLIGVLAVALVGYSVWIGQVTIDSLPGGYKNPVLALELVANKKHIEQIFGAGNGTARSFILSQLKKDIGFIILYVVLFAALSLLMFSRSKWLALTGVGCAVLAGFLDFMENRGMWKAMSTAAAASDELARSIRYPSLGKWTLVFLDSILIGVLFLYGHKISFDSSSLGWIFVLSGSVGLSGVLRNLVRPKFYRAFPAALALGALSTVLIALLFGCFPAHVVDHLYPR